MSNEFAFIEALRSLPLHPGARGLNDDAAVLEVGGETLVITHDTMVEGVHVLPDHDPADTAWKLVAVNLSDLAAKGAEPVGVLLSHSLGEDDERFVAGLAEVLTEYDVRLLGGDTVSQPSGPRSWGLTAIGRATHTPVPSRDSAQAGDVIYLCGVIGDAIIGYRQLLSGKAIKGYAGAGYVDPARGPYFKESYLRPEPLLREGIALAPLVTAMMDVSDGLFLDATRLAEASGVTCEIDFDAVPFSSQFWEGGGADGNQHDVMSQGWTARRTAAAWGDDYALLFTAPPGVSLGVEATPIGRVTHRGDHPLLVDGNPPRPDEPLGYRHGR